MAHEDWRNYLEMKHMKPNHILDEKFHQMAGESDQDADDRWRREESRVWYKFVGKDGAWYAMQNRAVVRSIRLDREGRTWVGYDEPVKVAEGEKRGRGKPSKQEPVWED